jgi:hypothetical protein
MVPVQAQRLAAASRWRLVDPNREAQVDMALELHSEKAAVP